MNIKNLREYRALKNEINTLKKRIGRLSIRKYKLGIDTVSSSSPKLPYTKRTITIAGYGYDASKNHAKIKLKKRLRERLAERTAKFEAIQAFIDSVDDSAVRQIIEYRYIDGLSWLNIAMKMGSRNKSTPYMIVKRFFEKN